MDKFNKSTFSLSTFPGSVEASCSQTSRWQTFILKPPSSLRNSMSSLFWTLWQTAYLDFCGYLWLSGAKVSQQPVCVCVQGDWRCLNGMLKLTKVRCRILFSKFNNKKKRFHIAFCLWFLYLLTGQVNDAEFSVALLKVNFYWLTAAGLNPQNLNFSPKAGFKLSTAATASICLTKINWNYV